MYPIQYLNQFSKKPSTTFLLEPGPSISGVTASIRANGSSWPTSRTIRLFHRVSPVTVLLLFSGISLTFTVFLRSARPRPNDSPWPTKEIRFTNLFRGLCCDRPSTLPSHATVLKLLSSPVVTSGSWTRYWKNHARSHEPRRRNPKSYLPVTTNRSILPAALAGNRTSGERHPRIEN